MTNSEKLRKIEDLKVLKQDLINTIGSYGGSEEENLSAYKSLRTVVERIYQLEDELGMH